MFTDRTIMVSLFSIVTASSLIVVSGFVNIAFAETKKATNQNPLSSYPSFPTIAGGKTATDDHSSDDGPPPAVLHKDKSVSSMSHSTNSQDPDSIRAKTHRVPEKDLKNFSKCRSSAAADGDVTPAEVMNCFHQGF
jgi:hypothetical protein